MSVRSTNPVSLLPDVHINALAVAKPKDRQSFAGMLRDAGGDSFADGGNSAVAEELSVKRSAQAEKRRTPDARSLVRLPDRGMADLLAGASRSLVKSRFSEKGRGLVPIDYQRTAAINSFSRTVRQKEDPLSGQGARMSSALSEDVAGEALPLRMPVIPCGTLPAGAPRPLSCPPRWGLSPAGSPGGLSARFESGSNGSAAIGYDSNGGTSYGKYQVSSKQGSFDEFIQYLSKKAPALAGELRAGGEADTGSCSGRMPEIWKRIAAREGQRFEALQEDFVRDKFFTPALGKIMAGTGLKREQISGATQEVIWSTAVQHGVGGASRIFNRAADRLESREQSSENYEKALISEVYALRSRQFGASSPSVRRAVQRRFEEERELALAMLEGKSIV